MKVFKIPYKATLSHYEPFTVYNKDMKPYEKVNTKGPKGYQTTVRPGSYVFPVDVKITDFRPARLPDYPAPQRFRGKNLTVEYDADLEGWGSVNWKDRKIKLHTSLKRPENAALRDFVLFHELAHAHYRNEAYCDLFAAKKCNKKGDSLPKIMQNLQEARPGSNATRKVVNLLDKYHKKAQK